MPVLVIPYTTVTFVCRESPECISRRGSPPVGRDTEVRRWLLPEKSGAGPRSVSPEGNASHTSPLQPPPRRYKPRRKGNEDRRRERARGVCDVHTAGLFHAWRSYIFACMDIGTHLYPPALPLPSSPNPNKRARTQGLPSGNDDFSRPSPKAGRTLLMYLIGGKDGGRWFVGREKDGSGEWRDSSVEDMSLCKRGN
ncbi:hypothetical protein V8E53_014400 [Lactarius tabidus]